MSVLDLPPHDTSLPPGASQADADEGMNVFRGPKRIELPNPYDPDPAIADDVGRLTPTSLLVREAVAAARMRNAIGNYTQLDCIKKIGSWRRGGGPNISRRWVAAYGPDEENAAIGECDKRLVTTTECLSPEEAAEALLKNVRDRGMWPVEGTVAVGASVSSLTAEHEDDSPISLGKLDGAAMEAAHGAADADDQDGERWDGMA